VLIGDDQPHPDQAAAFERGEEAAPEHLVLAVADVEAEDLAAAVGGDPGGDHDRHRHDLGGGVAYVQVGRVEVHVREGGVVQSSGRNAVTTSSRPAQMRDTSDLEMPESIPSAATRSSTERVDTPAT
jgi:hypothetical protein